MKILNTLKAKYHHFVERKYISKVKRKQFNMTIAEDIITAVSTIASMLEVPKYVAVEHLLQVGALQIIQDMHDQDSRQALIDHLVRVHLLGNELLEDNEI